MNGAASGEIAELQCASNEVEDTCLSPPLLCSLGEIFVGLRKPAKNQSAQYEVVW